MKKPGIIELHEKLNNKEITSEDLIREAINNAHELQEKCNAFVTIMDDANSDFYKNTYLSGIPYGIKDNYSTKDILSTGSSNTLKDFVPFFDATAVINLKNNGAVGVAKTALDEFGMGGTGLTAHTGIIKNPWDNTRICGGSSAGSACSVAAGVFPYALGSDTGDSIRKPAAYCGIVGYKPTYGMISRYGLFPFASGLDTCGVLTRSVSDAALVVDAMKGIDENDQTSWDSSSIDLFRNLNKDVKGKKLFYIKEIVDISNYPNANAELKVHLNNFNNSIEKLKNIGVIVDEVSIDKTLLSTIPSVYVCISCAEATSNNSNLTGIPFGSRVEASNVYDIMMKTRTKGFSELIKRRFVIGSYVLQKENQEKLFLNASRVRRLIVDRMNELFKKYDGLIMPTSGDIAPLFDKASDKLSDEYLILGNHLVIGNFGGFPSISIPSGFVNNMPVSVNITGRAREDYLVLNMANKIEEVLGCKGMVAKDE